MGVNTTKVAGYRTMVREMMEWLRECPGYSASAYNPYVEAESFLFEVMNELDFIEDDLNEDDTVIVEEPIERGE